MAAIQPTVAIYAAAVQVGGTLLEREEGVSTDNLLRRAIVLEYIRRKSDDDTE